MAFLSVSKTPFIYQDISQDISQDNPGHTFEV